MSEEGKTILDFRLSLDDVNIILQALGERPFKEVYEIIGKINFQANQQLGGELIEAKNKTDDHPSIDY